MTAGAFSLACARFSPLAVRENKRHHVLKNQAASDAPRWLLRDRADPPGKRPFVRALATNIVEPPSLARFRG
jgi:hypothetical protein